MTPHISSKKEDISNIVLMPGDPLRAKYIAENFLENAKLVNSVRNVFAYTGYYKNKKITILRLEWECQVLEFILMNYINSMMLIP